MNEIDQLFADFSDALRRRDRVRTSMRDACETYVVERSWDEVERLTGDDFAVSVGIERTRVTPRAGGEPVEVTQRGWTLARRGADGRWRFARGITNREA